MRRAPVRIRTFIVGTLLVLVVAPTVAGGAAWLIERDRQQARVDRRLDAAVAFLTAHQTSLGQPETVRAFAAELDRLDLLAQVVLATTRPPSKRVVFATPDFAKAEKAGRPELSGASAEPGGFRVDAQRSVPIGTRKVPATLALDLYYRPTSRTARALAAVVTAVLVLLLGLAAAAWVTGRWVVAPLARLSDQVDGIAGGDLAVAVPHSGIREVENVARAVDGMAAALGESAQRRTEADDARRFLVTSVAHDLRTPLFALRGHLQAIAAGLGDPASHLARAEARADALDRLVGNLFAYARDDYAQPVSQLEDVAVADLVREVASALEHSARLAGNTLELEGDATLAVTVDRDRARRALTNVVDNAVRHSPPGEAIRVEWAASDGSVEVTVRDRGPGIDAPILPHVFEPGIRGERAPADDGAGLGLAIAKRLLEHQGATIAAANGDDGGAVVRVVLRRSR
jgi:signal transduction histidine kinase